MRLLVLGGTSFIGRHIVEAAVSRGDQVMVVHRGVTVPENWVDVVRLETERHAIGDHAGAIRDFAPDGIVDSYALTGPDVDAALPALPDAPTVVLSSQDVYEAFGALRAGGFAGPVPIYEGSPLRRERYPYRGLGYRSVPEDYEKIEVEERWLGRGACVLRLPAVYGPHDTQVREWPILRRVTAGRRHIPVGPGTLLWTRAHVDDVAAGVLAALDTEAAQGEVFNLGEKQCYPIRIWLEQIIAATGVDAELVRVREDVLAEDLSITKTAMQHVLVSTEKAESLIGWRTEDPVQRVAESVRWHLKHPQDPDFDDMAAAEDDLALDQAL